MNTPPPTDRLPDPREGSKQPPTPERIYPDLEGVPRKIREVAGGVAEAFEVEPVPVAAGLLGILASLLGTEARCQAAGRAVPVAFSVLTITPPGSPARQGWLDFLQAPLHFNQDQRELNLKRAGEESLRQRHQELGRDLSTMLAGGRPESELVGLADQKASLTYEMAPRFIETEFTCDRLRWSLLHCADGGVLVVESRRGMAADLEGARPSERACLEAWMRASWEGEMMLIDRHRGTPGRVTIVRSLPESDLHRPEVSEFLGGRDPAPILLVGQGRKGRLLPLGALDTLVPGLMKLINDAFLVRLRGTYRRARLHPDGYGALERFRDSLEGFGAGEPDWPMDLRAVEWMPDLAIRMATVFALFRDEEVVTEMPEVTSQDLDWAIRWIEGWLVASHRRLLGSIVSGVSVKRDRLRLQLTDIEQRIYHRIVERPGLGRRDLLRSLHGFTAEDRDGALTELFIRQLVRPDASGRLFAA
jgi:hypothetical protein